MYRYDKYLAKNLLSVNESEIFRHTFHLNIVRVCIAVVNSIWFLFFRFCCSLEFQTKLANPMWTLFWTMIVV